MFVGMKHAVAAPTLEQLRRGTPWFVPLIIRWGA